MLIQALVYFVYIQWVFMALHICNPNFAKLFYKILFPEIWESYVPSHIKYIGASVILFSSSIVTNRGPCYEI